MRFDGQDPSLAPLEDDVVSDRRTPAPLSDRHRDHAPQSTADRHDESTLVDARSRTTDQSAPGASEQQEEEEGGEGTGEAGPTAAGAKTWHNPIFADKARGIRTRALRFVSFSFPRGRSYWNRN